jgi:hypothetical protein
MREKRFSRTQCNLGVPGVPPPLSSRVHCGRSRCGRPLFIARRRVGSQEELVRARGAPDIADIDDQIAIVRENLRELIEQAAAYSGAADDELVAQRIADQEARLELLTRRGTSDQKEHARSKEKDMKKSRIKKNMEVIGADGVHVGTVDRVTGDRIRLIKADSGEGRHKGHHHYIQSGLVADVEGDRVRLSANAANAVTFEEEASGEPT